LYSKIVGRIIKRARKMQNWEMGSQKAKIGKNSKINFNNRELAPG
jgi:hypothetical protein